MAAFITPVQKTLSADDTYEDVDCSSDIPVGSTGVMVRIRNTSVFDLNVALRKNGSTDDYGFTMEPNSHAFVSIGVDGSRIFEARAGAFSSIFFDIIGSYGAEAVFFTNAVVKTFSAWTWSTVSISSDTGADTAIAAIVYHNSPFGMGLRKTGSTDDRAMSNAKILGVPVGVDGSEQFDAYADSGDVKVIGYMTSGITWHTNGTDRSLGSTGSYADLTALPSGAIGGIYQSAGPWDNADDFAMRKNGSSEDIYLAGPSFVMVEADASRLVEGKIETTDVDFWELGYFTATGGGGTFIGSGLIGGILFGGRLVR